MAYVPKMAALAKLAVANVKVNNLRPCIIYSVTRYGHSLKDFAPGPLPKTPEERRKAAEKYGVPLSKYETYPDDGLGYGDYPKLPMVSGDSKSDFYPWDLPALKRNFNEPIHVYETIMSETRYDVNVKHRFSMTTMVLSFLGTVFGMAGLILIFERPTLRMYPPALRKQLYSDNIVHYDFPPCKGDPVLPSHH